MTISIRRLAFGLVLSLVLLTSTGRGQVATMVQIGGRDVAVADLPAGLVLDETLGLVRHESVTGQVVHLAPAGKNDFETRAVLTPKGDFLLMFPEGKHYSAGQGKLNTMLAYRSTDAGRTWQGPKEAFDIDYSQHGFVPLIPRGTARIYAFGTQPIPSLYTREHGQHENAPIGFRWSDDDGHSWSDMKLIRPENDPDFLGMSVMRMCETDAGTWIIGAHDGDWSKKPLITRQYLLRSEDQGKTWNVLPGPRPNGWSVKSFGRMDEGRPIALGGPNVLAMFRTPEGHLWTARSIDDGRTWSDPKPSPLVHPDAPPMLFHLSDGKTLMGLHHNRFSPGKYEGLTAKMEGQKDRSEIWVSLSKDEGRTWSQPRFVYANALAPDPEKNNWINHNCSYNDVVVHQGIVHIFVPHRWARVLHLRIRELDLDGLPPTIP